MPGGILMNSKCGAVAKEADAVGVLIKTLPYRIDGLVGNPDIPMGLIENRAGLDLLKAYKKNPKSTYIWSKNHPQPGSREATHPPISYPSVWRASSDPNLISLLLEAILSRPILSSRMDILPSTKARGDETHRFFKNTAAITKNHGSKTLASPVKQGDGSTNVLDAVKITSSILPDHNGLLDTKHLQETIRITISGT
ncbi:hypothetical protein BG011_010182, partial [Mortierella polycephala]